MSVGETALIFAGIPLAIILVFAFFIWVPGWARKPRYRPEQPWEFEPVWYCPHPKALEGALADAVADTAAEQVPALGSAGPAAVAGQASSAAPHAIEAAPAQRPVEPAAADLRVTTARGGAHGGW